MRQVLFAGLSIVVLVAAALARLRRLEQAHAGLARPGAALADALATR
jgi:hypothetical protein